MQTSAPNLNPMQYFDLMFGDTIINMFVHYTNLYAAKKNASKSCPITKDEMYCFIGILLYSGYVIVPRRYMYWQNASDCGMPIIYNAMSRDRFTYIMSNLHCCDNSKLQSGDKFAKLRELFQLLNQNFAENAPFEEHYSIDEAMVPYYGGHPCKQFIRGKPIRWGYKFWVGATRLGYILWFEPYQGKCSTVTSNHYKNAMGLGASVVLEFADVLKEIDKQAPFHLFFDNFFTSIYLIDELRLRGIRATGTVRENRVAKCPLTANKFLQKTPRGTFKYQSTSAEHILVCKWHDNSVVTVASNAATIEPVAKVKRFSQQQKKYILVDQPAVIKKYNENMGGVDRSDQNIGLYRTSIRGKKWYFSLICHALDMAVQNAWQLYKNNGGEYDSLNFRRYVATSLLESYKKNFERKDTRASGLFRDCVRFDGKNHIISATKKLILFVQNVM
ncbi:piggyBac transposable element-derived protein 3-like [Leguminivora glycinivorella]|uniref:piggyBac transposable element-derived protein 3-like n=1 Tax=Leguminivora glycinivorella TaxID=1035111 RepID=UPI00200D8B32|nr:piggyBac transposable element-derived protein 3-like [Leguminivora glycinivorella]